jgi:hypothetical protein
MGVKSIQNTNSVGRKLGAAFVTKPKLIKFDPLDLKFSIDQLVTAADTNKNSKPHGGV